MRIAIDLRALDGASKFRGIGVYIAYLLNQLLPELVKDNDVILYIYNPANLDVLDSTLVKKCQIMQPPRSISERLPGFMRKYLVGILPREFNRSHVLPLLKDLDVFFQPYHEMGVPSAKQTKARRIVVCHDLIPLIFKDHYFPTTPPTRNPKSWLHAVRRKFQRKTYFAGLKTFNQADAVIAVSEHTKKTLVEHLLVDGEKISVVLHGPPPIVAASSDKKLLKTLNQKSYITYVGGVDYRREIAKLVETADSHFAKTGLRLVVAGRDFEITSDKKVKAALKKAVVNGSVVNLGYITDAEKRTIIEQAAAFVYPTNYEGFGIPVLEAFKYKTPIITYANSSIPEVGGRAAIYVNSVEQMYKKSVDLLDDSLRKMYVTNGNKQVKKFSWQKSAEQTKAVIYAGKN